MKYLQGLLPGDRLFWHKPGDWMDVEIVSGQSYRVIRSSQDCKFEKGYIYDMTSGFVADGRWNVAKAKECLFDKLYKTLKDGV